MNVGLNTGPAGASASAIRSRGQKACNGPVHVNECQGPRAAFFTDTFEEPNGVATISQQFLRFASQHEIPFLLIRPGRKTRSVREGTARVIELRKSHVSLPLGTGLKFDFLTPRHFSNLRNQLERFKPDVIHVTGPGDLGMLGARLARLLGIPLVISWHTNVHQYADLRCRKLFRFFPVVWAQRLQKKTEHLALRATARFYRVADLVLAPNEDILTTLTRLTGRPGQLMPHGVDCQRFQPNSNGRASVHRQRPFTIGHVGRLTPEKNVRILAELETDLLARGFTDVRFLFVGDGPERAWLARRMKQAAFEGVLGGEALAQAYAQMDLLVFPSQSDTFGLVQLEAMASGLPVIAFRTDGPAALVQDAETGFLVETVADMAERILALASDDGLRASLSTAARLQALQFSWEAAFKSFYGAYAIASLQPDHNRSN